MRTAMDIQPLATPEQFTTPAYIPKMLVKLLVAVLNALHESRCREAERVIHQYRDMLESDTK